MAFEGSRDVLAEIHRYAHSTAHNFAELITKPADEWAEEVSKATGKPKAKLLEALEWGMKELHGIVSETALKAITTIAADEEGALL